MIKKKSGWTYFHAKYTRTTICAVNSFGCFTHFVQTKIIITLTFLYSLFNLIFNFLLHLLSSVYTSFLSERCHFFFCLFNESAEEILVFGKIFRRKIRTLLTHVPNCLPLISFVLPHQQQEQQQQKSFKKVIS